MSKSLNLKINKNEVELALTQKSEKSEMNKLAADLKNLIQSKASNDQVNQLLNDKISKSELLFYLSNKASIEDISNILEEKIGVREFEEIINEIELIKKEKLNINIFNKEIKDIKQALDNKPNSIDVVNALDTKADKDELNIDLNNKIDKKEINKILDNKINKNEIDKIYKLLDSKINKNELKNYQNINNALNDKADNSDFKLISEAFQDMKMQITKRIDDIDNDFDRFIDNIKKEFQSLHEVIDNIQKNKIDNSIIEQINEIENKKVDNDIMEENLTQLKNSIFSSMNNFMAEFENNQKNFEKKIIGNLNSVTNENQTLLENLENLNTENNKIKNYFENNNTINEENDTNMQKMYELIQNIQMDNENKIENMGIEIKKDMESLMDIINKKIDGDMLNDCILKLDNEIHSKIDSNELQETQDKLISDINNKIKELYEDILKELSDKITKDEINILMKDQIDKKSLEQKLSQSIKDYENFKNITEEIKMEMNKKIDINIFNKIVTQFNSNFENIKNDIKVKSDTKDIKDISQSLKTKANIEQINQLFNDINDKLSEKTNNSDFTTAIDNQAIINDTLCNENCIGRWVWRSGKIKSNYSVPWESQSVNTSPDNFIWEKDKTYIVINEEGLYELNFGFFSDKKPNIQILVNGEIIINSQNNNNNLLLNNNNISSRKNITGLSVIEFIMLPKQSKLSVCYNGGIGSGFVGLKKL